MTNTVLSEDDVRRIKHEERFREEVRKALASEPPKVSGFWQKLWSGLNSTFGIWFLTAFFVTGLGSFASKWYEQSREKEQKHEAKLKEDAKKQEAVDLLDRQRRETYERVTLEISYRYSATIAGLRAATERLGSAKGSQAHAAIVLALEPLTRPSTSSRPPLFKEYESYSGLALVAELRRHSGPGEASMLKEILAQTSALLHEITLEKTGASYSAKAAAAALVGAMRNPKWDNGFAYTDCRSDNPFC